MGAGYTMHHKFVVIDFDKPTARVYMGSYNFSSAADTSERREPATDPRPADRRVLHGGGYPALRPLHFRVVQMEAKDKKTKLELAKPPDKGEKPWWEEDYKNPRKIRDRELFA